MIRKVIIYFFLLAAFCCAATSPPAAHAASDLVVMRVSGQPITEKQVLQTIDQLVRQEGITAERGERRRTILYNSAIENLIISTLLANEARSQNVVIDKALVDQRVQALAKQIPENDFKALEKEIRRNVEESLGAKMMLERAVKDLPAVTEEECMKFYNENPDTFTMKEHAVTAHIVLRIDPESTPEQKAEIKKKLTAIRAEIESNKITFADAAGKYSQDPATAKKGGDFGIVIRDPTKTMESADYVVEDAIFETPPGSISPIIETTQGYQIFLVKEIKPAGKESFEEAKPKIQEHLAKVARNNALKKYMQGLKDKADVEYFMTEEEFFKRHPEGSW